MSVGSTRARVLCLLNPLAADGLAVARWPKVAEIMNSLGIAPETLAPSDRSIGQCLLEHLETHEPSRYSAIAGLGGDGTHSMIINAIMTFGARHPGMAIPPYAFIPMGTGNDIAKSFGLANREDFFAADLRRAISTIIHGADYKMDLGRLGQVYFADALAIGVDPMILRERNASKRRLARVPLLRNILRGNLLYTLSTGMPLVRQEPVGAEIIIDGRPWYSGPIINLLVNNMRVYAGVFDFSPASYANDGLLDVSVFTDPADYLSAYFLALRHHPQGVRRLADRLDRGACRVQGRQITITLAAPQPAHMDGDEIQASARFEIEVVPSAIHIKTPAEP